MRGAVAGTRRERSALCRRITFCVAVPKPITCPRLLQALPVALALIGGNNITVVPPKDIKLRATAYYMPLEDGPADSLISVFSSTVLCNLGPRDNNKKVDLRVYISGLQEEDGRSLAPSFI